MNRRLRRLCRSSNGGGGGGGGGGGLYLKYLRPGALAQLRDSKISARSHSRAPPKILLYNYRSSSSPPSNDGSSGDPQIAQISVVDLEAFPCFAASRGFGPRCPQRKKLVAAKSFFFVNSSPGSPPGSDSDSPDLGVDLIVSH